MMKKRIHLLPLFCLITACFLLTCSAFAAEGILVIPGSTLTIEDEAFMGDASLDKVIVQEGTKSIGNSAFADSGLSEIELPSSLESLDITAFDGCTQVVVYAPASSTAAELVQDMIDAGKANLAMQAMPALNLGANSVSVSGGQSARCTFTPAQTGTYSFYTDETVSCINAVLYSSAGETLASDQGSLDGHNFVIVRTLTAGETYELEVNGNGAFSEGTFNVITVFEDASVPAVLQEGTNTVNVLANAYTVTQFTADEDSTYTFYSTGSNDTIACLYDADDSLSLSGDDDDGGQNFVITQELTAGQQVYLRVKFKTAGLSGEMTVAVDKYVKPVYRALLIGEKSFSTTCKRNECDVNIMNEMLATVNDGEYIITAKIDRTKAQVQSDIASTFSEATENDVSLFFFASHGVTQSGSYYGALCTYEGGYIKTNELASWLSQVPGKVIVVIETCGSGAVIETNGEETAFDPEALDAAIIQAFAAVDSIIPNYDSNAGELATGKFYVMTASLGGEYSWGWEGRSPNNYFTVWFVDGVGTSGSMPADTNHNGALTLHELYTYVKDTAADTPIVDSEGVTYYQHPQVYPTNSSYVLFTR